MNADISSLRFRLEQGWQGDAAAAQSASNLLDEGSELEKVTRQLTAQLAYNNELLRQLQELEEQQLASQKDAAEKKVALRQALGVSDAIRTDMLDLKRKLALAEQASRGAAEDSNRARVEAGIKAREVDGLLKFVEESKVEISSLRTEADDARRELDRAQREIKQLRFVARAFVAFRVLRQVNTNSGARLCFALFWQRRAFKSKRRRGY